VGGRDLGDEARGPARDILADTIDAVVVSGRWSP
jgi:hypothetical protein